MTNDMKKSLEEIKFTFIENVKAVDKLINFDRDIQDLAIQQIEELSDRLKNTKNITNEQLNGERTLQMLRQIRKNDSLRSRYKTIFNQAVVLLVSYFGSTIGDVFRYCVIKVITDRQPQKLLEEDLRVSIKDICDAMDSFPDDLGDLFISKKDISFQDMKSIYRTFNDYIGVRINKDNNVNNIILGQACRHSIVHAGARIDKKLISQVSGAMPREIKLSLVENKQIEFSPDEINILADSMKNYLDVLIKSIREK